MIREKKHEICFFWKNGRENFVACEFALDLHFVLQSAGTESKSRCVSRHAMLLRQDILLNAKPLLGSDLRVIAKQDN